MRVDARDTDDGCGTARTCVQNSRHYSVACKTIQECRISGSPLHAAVARRPTQRQLHCETRDSPRLYSSVVAQYSPRCTLSHRRGAALQSRRRRIPCVVLLAQRTPTRSGWACLVRRRCNTMLGSCVMTSIPNDELASSFATCTACAIRFSTMRSRVAVRRVFKQAYSSPSVASARSPLRECAGCTWRLLGGRELHAVPQAFYCIPRCQAACQGAPDAA